MFERLKGVRKAQADHMSFTNYMDELYQNTVLHGPPERDEEDGLKEDAWEGFDYDGDFDVEFEKEFSN